MTWAVDLCSGAGGFAEAARMLLPAAKTVGIEWDHTACLTSVAAGHPVIRADISAYPTAPFAGARLLMGGVPCQPWSTAGKGEGRLLLGDLSDAAPLVATGLSPTDALRVVSRAEVDSRSALVLEPVRWVRDLRPEFVVLEEVPQALPMWQVIAVCLRRMGYEAWTGILSAERYGVPQVRRRVFLAASRVGPARPPAPTHRPYRRIAGHGLFPDLPAPVGWGAALPHHPPGAVLESNYSTGGDLTRRGVRDGDSPAQTLTTRVTRVFEGSCGDFTPGRRTRGQRAPAGHALPPADLGVLQGFRRDYPWQGTVEAQRVQIGNAAPPPLVCAVIGELLGLDWRAALGYTRW